MVVQREVAVPAPTKAPSFRRRTEAAARWALLLAASLGSAAAARADGPAPSLRAMSEPAPEEQAKDDWSVESVEFYFSYLLQRGRGYQSQAGEPGEPGDERLEVIQPMGMVRLRQSEKIEHQIVFPVDVVSAASPDALDAVSHASATSEAGSIDITSSYAQNDDTVISMRYGLHWEEPQIALFGGLGASFEFAEDNATLSVNGLAIVDMFDHLTRFGQEIGVRSKGAYNANVALSQVLSPTTVGAISYGYTLQMGTLAQTWNSVPIAGSRQRLDEKFPERRHRHAATLFLAQYIPPTGSTVRASHRYYRDSFELDAHTSELELYQDLSRKLYVKGHYRFHTQGGVAFYSEGLPGDFDPTQPRTADSDLAPYHLHEYGLHLGVLIGDPLRNPSRFTLSVLRYTRSNNLSIHMTSMGYGGQF